MNGERFYFDTSALAKLVLRNEIGADLAAMIWDENDEVYTSRLSYPESSSAIVRAQRNGRISKADLDTAFDQFDRYWRGVGVVELTPEISRVAREVVFAYSPSGADAVHVASALSSSTSAPVIFVTWDQRQAEAAANSGLVVTPVAD